MGWEYVEVIFSVYLEFFFVRGYKFVIEDDYIRWKIVWKVLLYKVFWWVLFVL